MTTTPFEPGEPERDDLPVPVPDVDREVDLEPDAPPAPPAQDVDPEDPGMEPTD